MTPKEIAEQLVAVHAALVEKIGKQPFFSPELKIDQAGCRYFSIKDAAKHWKDTRGGTQLGAESLQFLKHARALVKIRGMK